MAPNKIASDFRHISWVSFGYGSPTASIAAAPYSKAVSLWSCPLDLAALPWLC